MKTLFAALAMLCLVGCIAYDDDSGPYKAPRRLKYITKAVNSIESRASQCRTAQSLSATKRRPPTECANDDSRRMSLRGRLASRR